MRVLFTLLILSFAWRPAAYAQTAPASLPLIPDTTGMETAWDVVRDPFVDSLPADRHLADQIRRGFEIFRNTPLYAPSLTGNKVSCNNCHISAGQRQRALPLVGVAGVFPEYNKRSDRLFSLEDRIVGCFLRSENGTAGTRADETSLLRAPEVLSLSAYITWISSGHATGMSPPWRGQNTISADSLLPPEQFDVKRGEALFLDRCVTCHGEDGQGVEIGDKKAGPLWGPDSWNDGAGAARVYTLAGMIRYSMPFLNPGSLTDEEAQHIAAFINSKPRPVFPHKERDYPGSKVPPDALYYLRK
jgi:thiosulfate dehydrogenase